jgi:Zinc-uptake complex component A periplasmic
VDGTRWWAAAVVGLLTLSGCTAPVALSDSDERVQVVTTTGILADLVRNVGGDRVAVDSIVPDSADAHAYEPTLRDVRNVVYADVAFSNYLLLEAQNVIKALDANLRDGLPNISLAEGATKYAAEIIPLVEDASLDTIWLGMRVRGTGREYGAAAGTVTATLRVRNTGNVRLTGRPRVEVAGPFGLGRRAVDAPALPEILPGGEYTATVQVSGAAPMARLDVAADLAPVAVNAAAPALAATGHTTVWAWPWPQAVLLLLCGGVGWLVLYRRRVTARALAAARAQGRAEAASPDAPSPLSDALPIPSRGHDR